MRFAPKAPILRDHAWLRNEYVVERKSAVTIGQGIGVRADTVIRWLTRHGIEVRKGEPRNQPRRACHRRRKWTNTIVCPVCHEAHGSLMSHVQRVHKIAIAEFRAQFPGHRLCATSIHPPDETSNAMYQTWVGMLGRCDDPEDPQYQGYGGRGIKVHGPWHDFRTFRDEVTALIGHRPPGQQLDRFPDNDGNYEPGNVRWATRKQQMRNTRANAMLTFNGRTQCVTAWAEETGIPSHIIFGRRRRGLPVERILDPHGRRRKERA